MFQLTAARRRLGLAGKVGSLPISRFNSQPPEGGWQHFGRGYYSAAVSTHSRPKAAGSSDALLRSIDLVSTHSRPKAAGRVGDCNHAREHGFNSQPPEGGWRQPAAQSERNTRFNSQPPEGGWKVVVPLRAILNRFQLTAARRRLVAVASLPYAACDVSTHSRPKAAG